MYRIIKYAIFIILVIILINALAFVGLSIYKSILAYILIVQGRIEERPGIYIAEALDGFLVALVLLVFTIGIGKLFLPNTQFIKGYELPWFKAENFSELKLILWEMLLTTLIIIFVSQLITAAEDLDWTMLIYPASILMLALSFKFSKGGH